MALSSGTSNRNIMQANGYTVIDSNSSTNSLFMAHGSITSTNTSDRTHNDTTSEPAAKDEQKGDKSYPPQTTDDTASTQQIIPPADIKDDDASLSQNPCDWSNLEAEKKKIDAWEKKQKDNLKAQIASTTTEANAERKGVDSQITQSKNACAAKKQAEREAAAKIPAEKEEARKEKVATATTIIKAKSQEIGFLAALQKWLASWGLPSTTTDVPVVADEKATT